jgi:hypothetical protein
MVSASNQYLTSAWQGISSAMLFLLRVGGSGVFRAERYKRVINAQKEGKKGVQNGGK